MLGIKQEALALELGDGWSQKKISQLEHKEVIDHPIIEEISRALKISPDAISSFDSDSVIQNISSFYDQSTFNFQCTFNPTDKLLEVIEENKKLYERLVAAEQEKVEILKKLLKER